MCLLVFAWNAHPRLRLVLAANRDEFHERPSAPLGWWQDEPRVLAGRDLQAGGTWMGAARSGRLAIVTNFRDLERPPSPDAPSRGALVRDYLVSQAAPSAFMDELKSAAQRYSGFNLLAGDRATLHYLSNRNGGEPSEVAPGIHGLSNHWLDSPWPKLVRVRSAFEELVASDRVEPQALFALLGDRRPADPDEVPDTGLPSEWERALSAPFVVHERYGTRCTTLLYVERSGRTTLIERRFDATGTSTGATRLAFDGPEDASPE